MTVKGLIAAVLVAIGTQQATVPSDSDWDWLNTNRPKALEALMPVESRFPQIVSYRTYRDLYHDVPELYFAISYAPAPNHVMTKLVATMTVPRGKSVQQQLLELHMSSRKAPLETLLKKVSMQQFTVTEEQCPALRQQFDALRKVALGLPDPNVIVLHPTMHRFVFSYGSDRIDAEVTDSNGDAVRWATDTVTALRKCTG